MGFNSGFKGLKPPEATVNILSATYGHKKSNCVIVKNGYILLCLCCFLVVYGCYISLQGVEYGGFNVTFCAVILILFVFLYDTLMMVAESTATCR